MAAHLLRRSCSSLIYRANVCSARSKAFPLLAVVSQKKLQDTSVIHTTAAQKAVAPLTRGKNYTKHWFDERAVAVGMLACVPIGIVYPCAAVNYALGVMIPLHNYWGIHHVIVDYVPKVAQPLVDLMWKALFLVQLGGLAYINYYDVGICKLVALTLNV